MVYSEGEIKDELLEEEPETPVEEDDDDDEDEEVEIPEEGVEGVGRDWI